jgi:hypothetical protein
LLAVHPAPDIGKRRQMLHKLPVLGTLCIYILIQNKNHDWTGFFSG